MLVTETLHEGSPVEFAGAQPAQAKFAIVQLHGRGATASNALGLARELVNWGPSAAPVLLAAPQAAQYRWYPNSFMAPIAQNEPWLSSAIARVEALVAELEAAGIPRERIVLSGFSQGACLATEFVARHPARYAAMLAFTGGLIGPPEHNLGHTGNLAGTPVLLSSGDPDPHVPWSRVAETAEQLRTMRAIVATARYPGRPHTVLPEELTQARQLLHTIPGWQQR